MSQMYQVQLSSSVSKTVHARDSVSYPLKLSGILPEEDLLELLRRTLVRRGFEADAASPDRLTGVGPAGEVLTVDLAAKTVTARLEEEKELATEVRVFERGYTRAAAAEEAREALEAERDKAAEVLDREGRQVQTELTERLADSEDERRRTLHEVLQEVYAEAVKQKAGQLGDVLEVRESTSPEGRYELLIKVAR